MRTLRKNKQKMYFSNFKETKPLYETDEDGNIVYNEFEYDGVVYKEPIEIGVSNNGYTTPTEMFASISMSGGEVEYREFGIDNQNYNAILITNKGEYQLNETSLIWFKSEIKYKDEQKTEIEPNSADYRVIQISECINFTKYILQKVVKNNG